MTPIPSEFERTIRAGGRFEIPESLSEWLKKRHVTFVLDGDDPQEYFPTFCPATGEKLADIPLTTKPQLEKAIATARKVFESGVWSGLSVDDRSVVVKQLGDLILKNRLELAILEALDTGKPIRETLDGDVPRAAQNFQFFSEFALNIEAELYQSGSDMHEATREPLGVVALITPWNLPLYLETWKLAPALMMGNSVILKPSELTPLTAQYFAELVNESDLPKGVFQVVQGFGEQSTGEWLVSHTGIDAISFTGETGTGRAIMRAAAAGPTRCSFELGGKGASIVFRDANLEATLSETLRAAFRNQGEICLASPRVYVEKSIFDTFVDKFTAEAKRIRLGHPLDWSTDMGSLISPEHKEKVMGYISKISAPAKLCAGEKADGVDPKGAYVPPTVVVGLSHDHPISKEEVFGPLVAFYPFEDEADVIQWVNSTPYGLSASIYTRDLERARRVGEKLRVGLLWINGWFRRDLRVPFGGQKRSGLGREGGTHSLDFFSEWKSTCWVGGSR